MSNAFPPAPPGNFAGGHQPTSDDNTMAVLAHIGALLVGFIAPLLVLLLKSQGNPYVRRHAVESLNFQITMTIGAAVSFVLMFILIGFLTLAAITIMSLVFCILATIAASRGEEYTYPLSIRLIK